MKMFFLNLSEMCKRFLTLDSKVTLVEPIPQTVFYYPFNSHHPILLHVHNLSKLLSFITKYKIKIKLFEVSLTIIRFQ